MAFISESRRNKFWFGTPEMDAIIVGMDSKEEVWKDVPGYEGVYQVSDQGRVKSQRRFGTTGGVLTPRVKADSGHLRVALCQNGKVKDFLIHRLVLFAFVGFPAPGLEGCHNNGDPADNRLENLRWDTSKANSADIFLHGRTTNPWAGRTHCSRGHELSSDNVYTSPKHPTRRTCKACQKINYLVYSRQGVPDDSPYHGSTKGYRRGCRCDLCMEANRVYNRDCDKRRREAKK